MCSPAHSKDQTNVRALNPLAVLFFLLTSNLRHGLRIPKASIITREQSYKTGGNEVYLLSYLPRYRHTEPSSDLPGSVP